MAFIQVNFVSKTLMRTVTINAILPVDKFSLNPNEAREEKPFKTLYLLHGLLGNYTDWVNGTRVRTKRGTPSSSSSSFICLDREGWAT